MPAAEVLSAFARLSSRLRGCGDPDDGGDLRALSMDLEGIEHGDALTDTELAEDLATLARLVAAGTVPQDEAAAFPVVAEHVRTRHDQVTPLIVDEIKEYGVDSVDDRVHEDLPDSFDARIVRTAFVDLTLRDDFDALTVRDDFPAPPRPAAPMVVGRPRSRSRESRPAGASTRRRDDAGPSRPDDEPPRPDGLTSLQRLQARFADVLVAARADLDEHGMAVFVDFVCAAIAREAARCTQWERRHQ